MIEILQATICIQEGDKPSYILRYQKGQHIINTDELERFVETLKKHYNAQCVFLTYKTLK